MSDPELGPGVLAPVHFSLPTAAESVAGRLRLDGNGYFEVIYDGTREKSASPSGWATFAFPVNHPQNSTFGTGINFAAAGGAFLLPVWVPAPMLLQSIVFRCTNTTLARTAEARVFIDRVGAATLNFLTGSDCTWSFTAAAAADQESGAVSGAGTCIVPHGIVWVAVRNTHATNTLGVGSSGLTFGGVHLHYEQNIGALGSTLDGVTGWGATDSAIGLKLTGRVLGRTTVP